MAMMGGAIAMSFAAAILIGPYVGGHYGVDTLFVITAFLAVLALGYLVIFIPEPPLGYIMPLTVRPQSL